MRSSLSPLSSTIAPSYPTQVEEAQLPSNTIFSVFNKDLHCDNAENYSD